MNARARRKVLIAGGAGFIGSHVADAHLAAGDEVWVLDDLSRGRLGRVPAGARFRKLCVRTEEAGAWVREARFDLINYQAAQVDVGLSIKDPLFDARVNIEGLLNILNAARASSVAKIVFASSSALYAETPDKPLAEDASLDPVSPYGVAKLAAEGYLRCYADLHGLPYVALRYGNVYGGRQGASARAGVVGIFCGRALNGRDLEVRGDGRQIRDFVHARDVARANVLAADLEGEGESLAGRAYNVGSGRGVSVLALARAVLEAAGGRGRIRRAPGEAGEIRRSVLDCGKLLRSGWKPRVSLPKGLALTLQSLSDAS